MKKNPHIVNGKFQSDKYPTTPSGKVPLSINDPTAQDLLWAYAQRRRSVDPEFSDALEVCLREAGYKPQELGSKPTSAGLLDDDAAHPRLNVERCTGCGMVDNCHCGTD